MMEEEKTVALSVLITREEYLRSSVRHHPPAVTGAGAVLSAAGLAGLFFGAPVGLTPAAAICIVALGLILLVYNGVLAPFLDRGAAAREFDSREELRMATAYRFTAESVWVENGRVTGELPLSLATDFQRTSEQIAFRFGRELSFLIPIRLLSGEQADFIERAFSRTM
ncbi:MAG: hypothetical protein HFJ80_06045 [Clostridiales bacterium]|nr:hypothetical protein [Clostridiales bacterium]